MNQPVEQFLSSAKTAVADATDLAATSFAGYEKLVELNMSTAKSALDDASEQLRAMNLPELDYVGFVEGDDIGKGTVDVIVTDGFSGNIALKTVEGTVKLFAWPVSQGGAAPVGSWPSARRGPGAASPPKSTTAPSRRSGRIRCGAPMRPAR